MNRPRLSTRLVGHSATVLTVMPAGAYFIYEMVQAPGVWPAAIIVAFIMHKVMQAHEQVVAYRQWQTAWDVMGGDTPPPKRRPRRAVGVLLGLGGVVATIAILSNNENSQTALGLAVLVGGAFLILTALAKLWRWSRRRRPASKATPVTICVTKPFMAVPDLRTAYRGLPEHCLRVLQPLR